MRMSRIAGAAAAACAGAWLAGPHAAAQIPLYTLPKNDFVWNWGQVDLERRQGMADIEISGTESFFRCDLKARMRISNPLSVSEVRQLENDLATRLDFIYAVSETMNYLEYQRALDWATLDCKKAETGPSDPDERAEREQAARDKMLRELERRRARQQRD